MNSSFISIDGGVNRKCNRKPSADVSDHAASVRELIRITKNLKDVIGQEDKGLNQIE